MSSRIFRIAILSVFLLLSLSVAQLYAQSEKSLREKYKEFVISFYVSAYLSFSQQMSFLDMNDISKNENYQTAAKNELKGIDKKNSLQNIQFNNSEYDEAMHEAVNAGGKRIGLSKDIASSLYPLMIKRPVRVAGATAITSLIAYGMELYYDKLSKDYGPRLTIQNNGFFQSPASLNEQQLKDFISTDFSRTDFNEWAARNGINGSYKSVIGNLSQKDRAKYLNLLQNQADHLQKTKPAWYKSSTGKTLDKLAATQNVSALLKFEETQNALMNKTNELGLSVKQINEELNELTVRSEEIGTLTRQNAADIEYLKLTMYSNLSTTDKMNWIKSNFLNLPEDQKQLEELKLKDQIIQEERRKIVQNIGSYCELADATLNFLKKAGIDNPVLDKLATAANYGTQGSQIVDNILSQNYVGAITGLSNLLFGGQSAQQQIMNVLAEQNKKLDKIIENQILTFKLLEQIDKKLDAMMRLQQEYFEEILKNVYDTKWGIKLSLDLQKSIIGESIENAKVFLSIDTLTTFEQKSRFWFLHPDLFTDINSGFERMLQNNSISPYFKLAYIVEGDIVKFRKNNFPALLRYYLKEFPKLNENGRYKTFLAAYTPTYKSLISKYEHADSNINVQPEFTDGELLELLDPKTLYEFSNLLVHFGRLRIFADKHPTFSEMMNPMQVVAKSNQKILSAWNNMTSAQLRATLRLVDLSIAQQQLLSGDLLIPALSFKIRDSLTRAILVQEENEILRANVGLFYLKHYGTKNKVTPWGYSFAYNLQDSGLLKSLFIDSAGGFPFSFSYVKVDSTIAKDSSIVMLNIDSTLKFQLPTPQQFETGFIIPQPILVQLIKAREILINEIIDYNFKESLINDRFKAANLFILTHGQIKNEN